MLCPFGPSEYRHLERSPCLRQGITPQQVISCINKKGDASVLITWHSYCDRLPEASVNPIYFR
jgi:hypothetical protein